jgi:hypothetical protein
MTKKYYILGTGYKLDDIAKEYPYEVWLDLQESQFPIVMLEGKGIGGVGGSFRPSEILQSQWKEHLTISGTDWLIPLCSDALNNRDQLDFSLVVDTYTYQHNAAPQLKEVD